MPYTTTWQAHGIIWTYTGILSGNELLNSNLEIFGDERFDDIRYQIVDLTRVEKVEATENHMRKIAYLDMAAARTNPQVKVAVVTTNPDGQGITNTYNDYTDGKSPWVTEVFATVEEALEWISNSAQTP